MNSRVILITGANGGLGQAIARSFLEESPDNRVILGVHTRQDRAELLSVQFPDRAQCLSLEVTDPGAWESTVAQIKEEQGRLDVLVNNAGLHEDSLLATMSADAWERVRAINLDAVFHGCQAVLPLMIAHKHGRIVNISSLSALLGPPGQANYASAKAGVIALTQSLAKEVARIGITVNAICPGYIDTEALAAMDDGERSAIIARIPARRLGRPEEIAGAVRFLAGAGASYITGSVLKIDGGIF